MAWVMTERKLIATNEPLADKYAVPNTRTTTRVFDVGDPAPAGHEGRPYTKEIHEAAGVAGDAPGKPVRPRKGKA